MLVIDDCQGIVGYDEAVACSKPAWHPLGKVQPLFDHDQRVLAGCFGCGQAFHDKLRVFISAFRHLLIKVRESLRRIFQFLPQRRLHLEFAERMGIRSWRANSLEVSGSLAHSFADGGQASQR